MPNVTVEQLVDRTGLTEQEVRDHLRENAIAPNAAKRGGKLVYNLLVTQINAIKPILHTEKRTAAPWM